MNFSQIKVSDLILVDHQGNVVEGSRPVNRAAWWFVTMERSCQAQLLAMAAGPPRPIDRETALVTRGQLGIPIAGQFQFRPLWDHIVASDPDLFD